jgi:hypothetical protein
MMSKYAQAAIKAVKLIHNKAEESPTKAWLPATGELFGEGSWGQKKGCPKNAFLGLCEEGLVKGVPQGIYNHRSSSTNKGYALKAVQLIKSQSWLLDDMNGLWMRVIDGEEMSHNYQMDVVISLWKNGLIET